MRYRRVGKSGLQVSEIGLGSWLTLAQSIDRKVSTDCIDTAVELGINFFDTADTYGQGEAERFLGLALKRYSRHQILIGTKCFFPVPHLESKGLSRAHIFASVENSLKNLNTDHIDLMQCHRFDPETPLEETVDAMNELIRQGKILHWGVSRWNAKQTDHALQTAKALQARLFISNQCPYNIVNNEVESLFDQYRAADLSIIAYSPLSQGILTGKYCATEVPKSSRGSNADLRKGMWDFTPEKLQAVARLAAFAEELGIPLNQLALAWCLRHSVVVSAIIGASRPEHIKDNVKASGMVLLQETVVRVETIMGREASA